MSDATPDPPLPKDSPNTSIEQLERWATDSDPIQVPSTDRTNRSILVDLGLTKKTILVTVLVAVVTISLGVFVQNYFSDEKTMERAIRGRHAGAVIVFVDGAISDTDERGLILTCLRDSLATKLSEVTDHFERIALSPSVSPVLQRDIITDFATAEKRFNDTTALADLMQSSNDYSYKSVMAQVLVLSPLNERRDAIDGQMKAILGDGTTPDWDHDKMDNELGIASLVLPESAVEISKIQELEQEATAAAQNSDSLQTQISKDESDLKDTVFATSQPPFTLSGFIIGQNNPISYEIYVPGEAQHALLMVSGTSFQSKGGFNLQVVTTGDIPVTVKEEYGGFQQSWHLYRECDSECMQSYRENLLKVGQLQGELSELRAKSVTAMSDSNKANQAFIREARGF
jgi:hypothetical protein